MAQSEPQAKPQTRQSPTKKRSTASRRTETPRLEIEVAKLQVHNEHILEAIGGLNTRMNRVETNLNTKIERLEENLNSSISELRKEGNTRFYWLMGITLGGFSAILAVIAKGFGWF